MFDPVAVNFQTVADEGLFSIACDCLTHIIGLVHHTEDDVVRVRRGEDNAFDRPFDAVIVVVIIPCTFVHSFYFHP